MDFNEFWEENEILEKITEILKELKSTAGENHHMGKSFMTSYQIAILLEQKYPNIMSALGLQIGGYGCGERETLAQMIAKKLSQEIRSGSLKTIEGGFLSSIYTKDIIYSYKNDNGIVNEILASNTRNNIDIAIFRYK